MRRLLLKISTCDVTDSDRLTSSNSDIYNNLSRLVGEAMEKYEITFRGISRQLTDVNDEEPINLGALRAIGGTLFDDGGCRTWGRVISLISLVCCSMKARQRCEPGERRETAVQMAETLAQYLTEEFDGDMTRLGGWETLEHTFPDPNLRDVQIRGWLFNSALILGACSLKALMTN